MSQDKPVLQGWINAEERLRPKKGSYLVANRKGQVAPWIDGVIHNQAGSAWDWEYGEAVTHWMPLPSPPHNDHEPPQVSSRTQIPNEGQRPASGSPDLVGRLQETNPYIDPDLARKDMNEAAQAIRALEAENFKLAAGSCVHELIGDEYGHQECSKVLALQRQLDQRGEWLDWALSELSTLLHSDLIRGMEGSPKGHLEHIEKIRKEAGL
jgi:hypothetical protein